MLILTFFFLGRNSKLKKVGLGKVGAPIAAAGFTGLTLGLLLNLYPIYASGYPVYTLSNLVRQLLAAVVGGVSLFFLGLASASLGVLGRPETEHRPPSWVRRGHRPVLLAVLTVALVSLATVAVAAVSYASAFPSYSCVYQPGNALYLKVVSDQASTPVTGLDVSGKLVSYCPLISVCTRNRNSYFETSTITTLGEWSFVTNATGYVTVPSSMLGGSAFWLTLTSAGHTYLAIYQICGGGTTIGQLRIPSGDIPGREIPASDSTMSSGIDQNGTQWASGCGASTFSGNATVT